jgi:hypothetical protein
MGLGRKIWKTVKGENFRSDDEQRSWNRGPRFEGEGWTDDEMEKIKKITKKQKQRYRDIQRRGVDAKSGPTGKTRSGAYGVGYIDKKGHKRGPKPISTRKKQADKIRYAGYKEGKQYAKKGYWFPETRGEKLNNIEIREVGRNIYKQADKRRSFKKALRGKK